MLLFGAAAVAEGPRFDPNEHAQMLQERLQLSAEQTDKVKDIFAANQGAPCREIDDDTERMQCRLDRKKEVDKQLQAVLTPEQMTQLRDFRKERRDKMRDGSCRGKGKPVASDD